MTTARLAIDIGGTFTDLALEHDGRFLSGKVLTTPRAPEDAVMTGVELILKRSGLAPSDLGTIIHGTTLATNAIIERKGARIALIVTEGFRDSLEIRRGIREDAWDHRSPFPEVLVPRRLRLPINLDFVAAVTQQVDGLSNITGGKNTGFLGHAVPCLKRRLNRTPRLHYSKLQRVAFPTKSFSHRPNTTRGRTAKTGSFIERMSCFIPDMSNLYLRS